MMRFQLAGHGSIDLTVRSLIIAGWAGRDQAAVQQHVEELQALGVAPPSSTPLFYRVGAETLTTGQSIQVVGGSSSGEAEAVLVATPHGLCVGLGSDHTDREAEAISVALSKQVCPKPMATDLWRLTDVAAHWDHLILKSWAFIDGQRTLYQEGTLAALLPVPALLKDFGQLAPGTAMFCGTLPTRSGIVPAPRFEMTLEDPVLGRSILHGYDVETLPAVS